MGVLFAALTTLCMLSLISAFYQADKVAVTLTLVNVGDVALFGLVIDRVSTLILFVVVFLGLLVTIYSTGYLTDKNREHPHNGTNRYYAFLLVFIGAMAGLVRMAARVLMAKPPQAVNRGDLGWLTTSPMVILLVMMLAMGTHIPQPVIRILAGASTIVLSGTHDLPAQRSTWHDFLPSGTASVSEKHSER